MRLPLTGDPVGPPEVAPPAGTGGLQGNHIGPIGLPKGLDRAGFLDIKYTLDDLPPTRKPPPDKNRPPIKLAELVQSRVIFCIPENAELLGYWDRVQDRLAKIRNCMDISGARRRLELFAPEIDPRLLVRMRAAGLSLDDVLNAGGDSLPPYRFAFLVEKARQYAGVAQAFGSQLLAALEKRDGEELARLRTVHEQNILKLRSQMTTWEIDAAKDALESLRRQQAAAEYRRDYFLQLQADGLSAPERVHQVATYAIATIATMEAAFAAGSAIAALLPNAGAPTAMTYGGREVSGGLSGLAHVAGALSTASRAIGETASIESSFQRRTQEWKHQVELAQNEIRQLATQITAAEIRRDIATESLKVHERSIEQVQEIFDFLRDRFTSFGRYTWLAAETQRLHRVAFNAALSMARLAEQACQFERPDEGGLALAGNYWEAGNAGLLAGDRLLLDLQNLERRHIETHQRTLEIEQSFSLARFAPDVLSTLKRTCSGQFAIPEWFFDMTYPGHYRRRIKAVRLSIPCVVGPYVNVGATLRLTQSYIRKDARLDSRVAVPLRHTSTIAASNAQSDAGVFEFSFRDERYLPFEGAGVDSEWELALPKVVRAFDYGTISDVILTISYAAEADDTLRQAAEGVTGVLAQLSDAGITRVLSLRHEFPDAWSALASGETQIPIEIRDAHVPFFLSPFDLEPVAFELLVEPVAGQGVVYPTLSFDSQALSGPGPDAKSALYSLGKSVATTVRSRHTLAVSDLGSMRKNVPGAVSPGLDESKVRDIALRVVLKRKKPQ